MFRLLAEFELRAPRCDDAAALLIDKCELPVVNRHVQLVLDAGPLDVSPIAFLFGVFACVFFSFILTLRSLIHVFFQGLFPFRHIIHFNNTKDKIVQNCIWRSDR